MSLTPWIPSVTKVADGQDVSAEVVNPILAQYTQRDQYLFEKFQELVDKSVLVAFDQKILPSSASDVRKNSVVFYDKEGSGDTATEGISPAIVEFSASSIYSSAYTPSNSSYAVGLVKDITGAVADIYLWGLIQLDVDIDDPTYGFLQSEEIDQDADFEPGPLYLSRTEAGKVTRNPGGVSVYVGYAFNRRNFLLAPNVSEFNQFFTSYKFNLLDRPSGKPVLTGSTWDVTGISEVSGDGGIDHVGWIPVDALTGGPLEDLVPDGAKFYYNLPSEADIAADTAIDDDNFLRDEQTQLSRVLPPNPSNVTLLTVNGVIQPSRDNDPDGLYIVNAAGIWWFDDQDGQQPWASDIPSSVTVTFNSTTDKVTVPNGDFAVGDRLRFETVGTMPTGLATATDYYVVSVETSGSDQLIKISTTVGGSAIDFTTNGSGTITISQLYIWKFANGTDEYRPRIALQFLKFNPSLSESIVTSIKKFNPGSNAIRFYKLDKTTEASSGDLLARLYLNLVFGTQATSSATSLIDVTYDETTGILTKTAAPSVSEIIGGANITITPRSVGGIVKPGSFIVSASNSSQTGKVNSIEPDGADLLYSGLNSYLNMPPFTTRPSSFIGKILLSGTVPDADMTLVLLVMGTTGLAQNAANKVVTYNFSYSVSKVGSVLDPSDTPTAITFNIPDTTAAYTANTVFKIGNVANTAPYSIPISTLLIPSSAFKGGDCSVNFKLARTNPGSNAYAGSIGIVDIYWRIG